MTYKHVKFEDSAVMRSLEKLAVQKGLVQPEPIAKTAAAPVTDLTPTASLTQNIVKLCAGLRQQGLHKYAAELEHNLLNYKKAQTLYETSPEKGEDVIEFAHPEGSHKLVGVEGDEAVVEDILDRQLKMLEVVNKKPTGKLSSRQAVDAVKVVFAQEQASSKLEESLRNKISQVNNILTMIEAQTDDELTFSIKRHVNDIAELLQDPKIDNIKRAISLMNTIHSRLDPSSWVHYSTFGATGLSEDSWARLEPRLNKAIQFAKDALALRQQIISASQTETPPTAEKPAADPLAAKFWDLTKSISLNVSRLSGLNIADKKTKDNMLQWLNRTQKEVSDKMTEYNENPNKSDPIISKTYQQYYDSTNGQVQKVEQWIKQNAGA